MSLVSSMNIASQALAVNQAAITVVSNNIANVDNENYSKLRVNLATVVTYSNLTNDSIAEANSLSGVQISSITRYSNEFLESYFRTEKSEYSYYKEYSTIASSIENLMNELKETGLSEAFSDFYEAASALADDPTNVTLRQNYSSCLENVCSVFNSIHNDLTDLQNSLVGDYNAINSVDSSQIGTEITEANTLLDQLAAINQSIIKTNSTDSSSSSLLDQRDALLEELSSYMPITTEVNDNGTVDLSLGSYDLVTGGVVKGHLDTVTGTSTNPAIINIVDPDDSTTVLYSDVNSEIDAGSIGAILKACGSDSTELTISGVIDSLNTLAQTFATTLNNIQVGVDASGTAMCLTNDYSALQVSSEYLLLNSGTGTTAGITAGNISINSTISENLYYIATARVTDPTDTSAVGDNSNITLVSESRDEVYSALGNQTFEDYLANEVSSIGLKVENIDTRLATQSSVLESIKSTLSSETGVSLDEELSDLIKYQQAYEAAARLFAVCSDLLETLVHLAE